MHFLCNKHRHELIQLPENEISDYWLDWMLHAGQHYEQNDWQRAKLFAGSAMDLTINALLRHNIHHESMAVNATLSTIYTINCCLHSLEQTQALRAIDILTQRLRIIMAEKTDQRWAIECIAALKNHSSQAAYFQKYLSLPLTPTAQARDPQCFSGELVNLH